MHHSVDFQSSETHLHDIIFTRTNIMVEQNTCLRFEMMTNHEK